MKVFELIEDLYKIIEKDKRTYNSDIRIIMDYGKILDISNVELDGNGHVYIDPRTD